MIFERLPPELHVLLSEFHELESRDLCSLRLTSRRLCALYTPEVFRLGFLYDESDLTKLQTRTVQKQPLWNYVTELHFPSALLGACSLERILGYCNDNCVSTLVIYLLKTRGPPLEEVFNALFRQKHMLKGKFLQLHTDTETYATLTKNTEHKQTVTRLGKSCTQVSVLLKHVNYRGPLNEDKAAQIINNMFQHCARSADLSFTSGHEHVQLYKKLVSKAPQTLALRFNLTYGQRMDLKIRKEDLNPRVLVLRLYLNGSDAIENAPMANFDITAPTVKYLYLSQLYGQSRVTYRATMDALEHATIAEVHIERMVAPKLKRLCLTAIRGEKNMNNVPRDFANIIHDGQAVDLLVDNWQDVGHDFHEDRLVSLLHQAHEKNYQTLRLSTMPQGDGYKLRSTVCGVQAQRNVSRIGMAVKRLWQRLGTTPCTLGTIKLEQYCSEVFDSADECSCAVKSLRGALVKTYGTVFEVTVSPVGSLFNKTIVSMVLPLTILYDMYKSLTDGDGIGN